MNLTNVKETMENVDEMIDVTESGKWDSLLKRMISSLVIASAFIVFNFIGGYLFDLSVIITSILMIFEWERVRDKISTKIHIAGFIYAGVFAACAIWLRSYSEFAGNKDSSMPLFYLILVVASNDIGAYFGGKIIGGPKLIPSISPNKTISGTLSGLLLGCFAGILLNLFIKMPIDILTVALINALICICAQTGDLLASKVKRDADIKDFGNTIPGHGGIIDRMDSTVFAMPVFVIILFFV